MINCCWFFFKWGLGLALAAVVAGGIYLYVQLDDEIRCHIEQMLADQYENLDIRIGRARLVEGQGIVLGDLAIATREKSGPANPFGTIDEIWIVSDVGLPELLQGAFPIERIVVKRPRCRIVHQKETAWNWENLFPLPKFTEGPLDVLVEEGRIEIVHESDSVKPLRFHDIRLAAKRQGTGSTGGPVSESLLEFELTSGSPDIQRLELRGTYDTTDAALAVNGRVRQLHMAPQLLRYMPSHLVPPRRDAVQVHGLVDFGFRFSARGADPATFQYVLDDVRLVDGRCLDPRLPLPLTHIQANAACDNEGLTIHGVSGRFGEAEFHATGRRNGWSETAPIQFECKISNLQVGRRLIESCPQPIQDLWHKFHPEGTIDIRHAQLTFDGHAWIPDDVLANCLNVTFVSDKFPYPITHSTGTIHLAYQPELQTNLCKSDLKAMAGGQPIQIESHHTHLGPRALGWVRVTGKNIPIDDALIEAIAPRDATRERLRAQAFVRSLHPTGRFDTTWLSWREDAAQEIPNTHLDILLKNCTVEYDAFPYPLRDIHGQIQARNGHWTYQGLQGTNNAGIVECNGSLNPTPNGNQLLLKFRGKEIALEQDLLKSLKPEMQEIWRQIQPRGRVDLDATMLHTTGQDKPVISVSVHPKADSVTIKPAFFPYALEQLEGNILLAEGKVQLQNMRAVHGQTELRTDGRCTYNASGEWQIELDKLSVDRLIPNDDLLVALPTGLRKALMELRPKGTFGIHNSQVTFRGTTQSQQPVTSNWKLHFSLHQATLEAGIKLENVNGNLGLEGASDGRTFTTQGEIDLDSLTYRDLQFTEVRGPFLANEESISVGPAARRNLQQPGRFLTANICGGSLAGGARIRYANFPQFALEASLTDGDLARLAAEHLPGQQNLRGRAYGRIVLQGSGCTSAAVARSLSGEGQLQVVDADIYEIPQIIRLLRVLRVQDPDKSGFTASNMKFRIDGEHIQFEPLELSGNAISLYGKGEMSFDKKLNLAFQAVIGPGVLPAPKLQRLLREASGQVIQINVRGTLENPDFESEPLPGLNHVLQQLQAELEPTSRTYGPTNPPRGAQRPFGPPIRW